MMNNYFYSEFDMETLGVRKGADYRTPFQRDRDRIIHSSGLRRLQAKTQVFLSGEYDFYRTRLTHSIEVAQIGQSICHFLNRRSKLLRPDFYINPDLVEAACLAHDLGHPPFGHAGESVLHQIMLPYGGFEGNAQTLRLLTEILYPAENGRTGIKPSRALLDGVLKYKTLMSQYPAPERHFIYDNQKKYLDFVFGGQLLPTSLTPGEKLNQFRSIECQIMDWADDTAYSLNDISDCMHARFINKTRLETWGKNQPLSEKEGQLLDKMIEIVANSQAERIFSRKIGDFIAACRLEKRENFMSGKTHRYAFQLVIDSDIQTESRLYKKIASNIVFSSAQQQQLNYKWDFILKRLWHAFQENYTTEHPAPIKLLPEVTHRMLLRLSGEQARMRTLCHHISGMTDRFAIRTYQRLFVPGYGSIVDLI